ncbi:hypothetical protein [Variovorax paradoxus]|uniref:hypothetical protein n=1 Tax=Variovorax paradoxus TaxID=34073 RepID=UPI0012D46530|nr:hypothetical protein [Variovorax paradoxus]
MSGLANEDGSSDAYSAWMPAAAITRDQRFISFWTNALNCAGVDATTSGPQTRTAPGRFPPAGAGAGPVMGEGASPRVRTASFFYTNGTLFRNNDSRVLVRQSFFAEE